MFRSNTVTPRGTAPAELISNLDTVTWDTVTMIGSYAYHIVL